MTVIIEQELKAMITSCKVMLQEGKISEARSACDKMLALSSENPIIVCFDGVVRLREQKYREALDAFKKSILLEPTYSDPYLHAADVTFHLGRLAESAEYSANGFSLIFGLVEDFGNNVRWYAELIQCIAETDLKLLQRFRPYLSQFGQATSSDPCKDSNDFATMIFDILSRKTEYTNFLSYFEIVLSTLGFSGVDTTQISDKLYTNVCVPLLKLCLQNGLYNEAFSIEGFLYNTYIKSREREDHFRWCFDQIVPCCREYGMKYGKQFPEFTDYWKHNNKNKKLAFFIHNASRLAHIQLVLNSIRGIRQSGNNFFNMTLFVFNGRDPIMDKAFRDLDVEVIYLEDYGQEFKRNPILKLVLVRRLVQELEISAIVWISLAIYMSFAFSMRIAPVQIWWAMKYHSIEIPEIDGYVTGYSITNYKRIYDKLWRTSPYGIADWYDASLTDEARNIRNLKYGNFDIVLGSFGREEKLNSPDFLSTIVKILQANPDCVFLWTGKHQIDAIQNVFNNENVAGQCHFIGWVNTKVYAQVVDVFLDSYPFPCGYTAFEAMAAKKPVLFYKSKEAYETGIFGMINPVLQAESGTPEEIADIQRIFDFQGNESLFPIATNNKEYYDLANKLIRNREFRDNIGIANQEFITKYVSSPVKMGCGYAEHFCEVIDKKATESK